MTAGKNNKSPENLKNEKGNKALIIKSILILAVLSGLQFLLIFTIGSNKLKQLDKNSLYNINITKILDLDFPSLNEDHINDILNKLKKDIKTKLGFNLSFKIRKTILINNYISSSDSLFDTDSAKAYFKKNQTYQLHLTKDMSWLELLLKKDLSKKLLSNYYKIKNPKNLKKVITQNFIKNFKKNILIRNNKGIPVFALPSKIPSSSSAYWSYIASHQSKSDFIISNSPIFFPSGKTPADAVSRGGMVNFMITDSRRSMQGSLILSYYSVLKQNYTTRIRKNILSELALQGFAMLLNRVSYDSDNTRSLLYPAFGYNYKRWYLNGRRKINEIKMEKLKDFGGDQL